MSDIVKKDELINLIEEKKKILREIRFKKKLDDKNTKLSRNTRKEIARAKTKLSLAKKARSEA